MRLLPPCSPSKIVCVGRNYLEHAKELGNEPTAEPLIFLKPPSALNASGGAVVHPPISQRLDYEGELGLVIGRRVRNVSAEEAEQAIFGYTCVDDFTLRDLQKKDGQWTRAKGFDTSCAVGPWIVPRAQVDFREAQSPHFGERRSTAGRLRAGYDVPAGCYNRFRLSVHDFGTR